jgi:peroxiredoxin Q/BCP
MPAELKKWRDEVGLDADLLSDADKSVALAWGAAESADQERPKRVSILVGPDGRVIRSYAAPDAETHPGDALADLG